MFENSTKEMQKAGTGFMMSLSEGLRALEQDGYDQNLIPRYDHFECQSGKYRLNPADFQIDRMIRFENTSDPDDQAIAYAISSPTQGIKGVYVESYGLYHDDLSKEMLERLKYHDSEGTQENLNPEA